MTTPVWPSTLPQRIQLGVSRKRQSAKVRSQMDGGPPKQRARFTAATRTYDGAMITVTGAQLATFDSFYEDDLGFGALSFTWVDPDTNESATLRFAGDEPVSKCIVPNDDPDQRLYSLTLPLEQLP